ncbi:hypothetical protein [Streptomyces sp. NPDC056464]|uniref:hypothetical protein n=1 Tax=Streptomyces sp. NPDC056464 TaxID=3345828 RepID=UPI00369AEEA5
MSAQTPAALFDQEAVRRAVDIARADHPSGRIAALPPHITAVLRSLAFTHTSRTT